MAAPTITLTKPVNNEVDVYINQIIYITFDQALLSSSVNSNTFLMYRSSDYSQIEGTLEYDSDTFKVSFVPDNVLLQDTAYTFIIVGVDQSATCVQNSTLENLAASEVVQFVTGSDKYEAPQEDQEDILVEDEYASSPTVPVLTAAPDTDFSVTSTYPENRTTNLGTVLDNNFCSIAQASGVPMPYDLPVALASGHPNPSGLYTISVTFNEDLYPGYTEYSDWSDWLEIEASPVNGDPAIPSAVPSGFIVPPSGDTLYWTSLDPNSWYQNNEILVTVSSDVMTASGTLLGADRQFMFTTVFNPMYCTSRKVRSAIGPYVRSIPDDTINRLIFENSLLAYELANVTYGQDQWASGSPSFAAKMYTCCKTQYDIIVAQMLERASGAGQMKRLGDFSIQEPLDFSSALRVPLDSATSCMQFWVDRLVGKDAKAHPAMAVKGINNTSTPIMRGVRTWTKTVSGTTPGANKRNARKMKLPSIYSRWS